ncbi:insulinase family protein [Sphingobacteriales bacterium UPWRP_1]|nr:peptidase M16 [Sphingobacteriales bacterium TSM_CSM]PSJ75376.1 insulinase family protein [Sphingobacteriales bacterium UPWRP_1]
MINYKKFTLSNGLRILLHEDQTTPLAVVNILYDVGSRDEQPGKTGFAHLFEHLMFGGSANIARYDEVVHNAGGESNAFTSPDITNFYCILPAINIETAFWLESDRMMQLNFSPDVLSVQKNVVVEEFKETSLNQPYGDVWHRLRALSYKQHPYRWPVIGLEPVHIEQATLQDVEAFFYRYYRPNNAILSIAGGIKEQEVIPLAEKWFGNIPAGPVNRRNLPKEPRQTEKRSETVYADVPLDAIYLSFHVCNRTHPDYFATDVLNDLLSAGSSARLYQALVKEQQLFTAINTHMYGEFDEGTLVIEGKLNEGADMQQAEAAIWQELEKLKNQPISNTELKKSVNRVESAIVFSETSLWMKAFSLAYYEVLGNADWVNTEIEKYDLITPETIQNIARQVFTPENCSALYYHTQHTQKEPAAAG